MWSARLMGQEVIKSLHPGQMMVKIVHDELCRPHGAPLTAKIYYVSPPPTIIMMAGLQGSGKTTTCGQAGQVHDRPGQAPRAGGRRPSANPAAVDQLTVVGGQVGTPVFCMERTEESGLRREAGRDYGPQEQLRRGDYRYGRPAAC